MKKTTSIMAIIFLLQVTGAFVRNADAQTYWDGRAGGVTNGGGNSTDNSGNTTDNNKKPSDNGNQSSPPAENINQSSPAPQRSNPWTSPSGGNGNTYIPQQNHSSIYHRFNSPNGSQPSNAGSNFNGVSQSNTISPNLRNMGITRVPRTMPANSLLTHNVQHSAPLIPSRGPSGGAFSASPVSPDRMNSVAVRNQMTAIAGNRNFMAQVAADPSVGKTNHYSWNAWNGYNYVTYYDPYGASWYGWYCGSDFFWTRYYCGNWWWYDPWWDHWCYWSNGGWWWENPATTTVYVYVNGNYSPANSDDYGDSAYSDTTVQSQPSVDNYSTEDNTAAVQSGDEPVDFLSQDGKFKVTVSAEGDAFLYNLKRAHAKPVYLDSNVDQVKFSKAGHGPLKILLIFKDGTFATFNADGSPADKKA